MNFAWVWLLFTWLCIWALTFASWTYLPTLTGVHGESVRPSHFLPWPPGIAIAVLAGSTGGLLNGLVELWHFLSAPPDVNQPVSQLREGAFALRPPLGALTAMLVFFVLAAGGLSLVDPNAVTSTGLKSSGDAAGSVGSLIYRLTPGTPGQLATLVTYTVVAGYFFPAVPELLDVLRKNVIKSKP